MVQRFGEEAYTALLTLFHVLRAESEGVMRTTCDGNVALKTTGYWAALKDMETLIRTRDPKAKVKDFWGDFKAKES